jgi:hypothetical protein
MKRTASSEYGDGAGGNTAAATASDIIVLNVGGTLHTTTRHLLVNSVDYFPDSLLALMFRNADERVPRDSQGHYFIDADFAVFRHVLNVLRRPSLVSDVPLDMSAEAWCCELDYWRLVKRDDVTGVQRQQTPRSARSGAAVEKPVDAISSIVGEAYDALTLQEMGRAIKKEIMNNELVVVRTILETTGYHRLASKTRSVVLRVPLGKHRLPWDVDLGAFVKDNSKTLTLLLARMLESHDEAVSIHESRTVKNHTQYEFDGKQYSTQEPTVSISINLDNLMTLQNRHQ